MNSTLRLARPDDLAALTSIYNHYVTNSNYTFDTEAVPPADRQAWFDEHCETGPHRLYVALDDDQLIGYAGSSAFHPKRVYDSSVELSVYVHQDHCGRGIGRRLYQMLLPALEREPGVHRLYAGITLPNDASMALHEGFGFEQVGRFAEVSHKNGQFWDLVWLERAA